MIQLLFLKTSQLYYDKANCVYYDYVLDSLTQSYQLRYHSKLKQHKWPSPSTLDSDDGSVETTSAENETIASRHPPSIRAILIEKPSDDESKLILGTLFLITYTGSSIGSSESSLINFRKLKEQSAFIKYNADKKSYFVYG
jgi:hypothetical protein